MSSSTPVLALRGLTKTRGDFRLGPLDLDLEPGRVLAFIGPNGAGKTTTLDSVMGLLRRDDGEIEICGRANRCDDGGWKQDVGYVGEVQGFYQGWSAGRNLRFIERFQPRWNRSHAAELARRFDLDLGKKVAALSRGNRAKLALIAALGHRPRLLLLDEPTQGLDPLVRAKVLEALWEILADGECAILYSTHVLSDVSRLADELAFLHDGHLMSRAAKDDLLAAWRRVSFRFEGQREVLERLTDLRLLESRSGQHLALTRDQPALVARLEALGASAIATTRLTIEEVAVEILKDATP